MFNVSFYSFYIRHIAVMHVSSRQSGHFCNRFPLLLLWIGTVWPRLLYTHHQYHTKFDSNVTLDLSQSFASSGASAAAISVISNSIILSSSTCSPADSSASGNSFSRDMPGRSSGLGTEGADVERDRLGGEGLSSSMMPKFERFRFLKKFTSRSFFTLMAISDAGSKRGACCTSDTSAEKRLALRIVMVRGTDSPFNSLRRSSWDQMTSAW